MNDFGVVDFGLLKGCERIAMVLESISIELFGNPVSFYYRPDSRADRGVMRQIFEQQDYNLSHWSQGRRLMEYYQSLTSPALIIDAGANIGASALYFLNCYRKSQVFALEPSLENWKLLELNTANHEFDVVHRGENLFLFNRKILSIK